MKKLTEAFNEISVKRGELFSLELTEMAGAGYLWDVHVGSGKATLLSTASKSLGGPDSIGGNILSTRIFRADEEGDIRIRAVHQQPWDKKNPPLAVKYFKIKVA